MEIFKPVLQYALILSQNYIFSHFLTTTHFQLSKSQSKPQHINLIITFKV